MMMIKKKDLEEWLLKLKDITNVPLKVAQNLMGKYFNSFVKNQIEYY